MGARGSQLERWPPASVVHRIHDRYLHEIVEGLNLCPFARRSRELGRVERPLLWVERDDPLADIASRCAAEIARVCARNPEVEIILLTFLVGRDHPWTEVAGFEPLVKELRQHYDDDYAQPDHAPRFYMVPFHPRGAAPPGRALTPESLVSLIRRTPDPVIQCVRARVLDDVRRQARRAAALRFREEMAKLGPEILALVEHSVQTDPELSSDIARHNFKAVGTGAQRERFEALIESIMAERDAAYARPPDPTP